VNRWRVPPLMRQDEAFSPGSVRLGGVGGGALLARTAEPSSILSRATLRIRPAAKNSTEPYWPKVGSGGGVDAMTTKGAGGRSAP
jgi:hypothetical protein